MAQSARKMKSFHRGEPVVVDTPRDVEVADAMSEDKSTAKDNGDFGRATEAPVSA